MAILSGVRTARAVGLVLAAAAIASCERPPTALTFDDGTLGVYSTLHAGEDTVTVLVIRHPPNATYLEPSGLEGVADADVALVTPSGPVTLVPAPVQRCFRPDDPRPLPFEQGCYAAALLAPVLEGATYGLRVSVPDTPGVEGTAVVPSRPDLVTPGSDAVIDAGGGLLLEWRPVEGAERYAARVDPLNSDCDVELSTEGNPAGLLGRRGGTADTMDIEIWCLDGNGGVLRPDSVPVVLRFTSVDSAYAAWAEAVADPELKQVLLSSASPGLRGPVIGFFSATAAIERRIVLDPEW